MTTAERYRTDPNYREKQKRWSRTYNHNNKIRILAKKCLREAQKLQKNKLWFKHAKKTFYLLSIKFLLDTNKNIIDISMKEFINWLGQNENQLKKGELK